MIALLANPLVRYAAAIAGVLLAVWGFYGWAHHRGAVSERAIWEKLVAEQKSEAARLIAEKTAQLAAEEKKSEELNVRLSKEVADARAETSSALDRYNAAVRLRVQAGHGSSCPAPRSPEAAGPVGNPELATPGIFVSEQALRDLGNLASVADDTAAVMAACKAWALEHGR